MAEIDMGNGNQFDAANGGVTQTEHDKNLAMAIEMRENEVYQYQINVNNYEQMLSTCADLPAAWPANLLQYKGLSRDQLAATVENDDDLEIVSRLSFRDELKMRVRSEKIERNKVNMILASLVSQATDIVKIRQIIADNKAARLSQPA